MRFPQLDFFLRKLDPRPVPASIEPEIHFAPRLKKGWRAEWHPSGRLNLTLPGYMREASFAAVRQDILRWCSMARKRKTPMMKAEIRLLEREIWERSEATLIANGIKLSTRGDRIPPIRTQGRVHDLQPHFQAVNAKYFENALQCHITWSGRAGGLSYHSKRKDPRTGDSVDLVSISRGYDFENCPDWALQGIIYHECLHIAVPPVHSGKRRVVHGREFRAREKQFHAFEAWKHWHATVLPGNVRRLHRRAK